MRNRSVRTIFLSILLIAFGSIITLTWLNFHYLPLNITEPLNLTLNTDGTLTQGTRKVGQFIPVSSTTYRLNLPIGEQSSEELQNILITISLPAPAPGALKTELYSIQGTYNMQSDQPAPGTLSLYFSSILPESHTSAAIFVPSSYLKVPSLIILGSFLLGLSLVQWLEIGAILFFITLVFCLIKSRKPSLSSLNIRNSPPEKITAMDLAVLIKSRIEGDDFSALLYDLANRGHIQIIAKEDDIYLIRQSSHSPLRPYELLVLNLLLPMGTAKQSIKEMLDSLSQKLFSELVTNIYTEIYSSLVEKGYFTDNPRLLHLHYKTIGILFQFFALFLTALSYFTIGTSNPGIIVFGIFIYLSGRLLYSYGYRFLPLSPTGYYIWKMIADFSHYLSLPEPIGREGSQGYLFYEYLPYTFVFKNSSAWLKRFERTNFYVPSWFVRSDVTIVSPVEFFSYVQKATNLIGGFMVKVKDPNVD